MTDRKFLVLIEDDVFEEEYALTGLVDLKEARRAVRKKILTDLNAGADTTKIYLARVRDERLPLGLDDLEMLDEPEAYEKVTKILESGSGGGE